VHLYYYLDRLFSVQETPNFQRRLMRVYNTADNADITQSQAVINHHWLLSYVTLGLVECRK